MIYYHPSLFLNGVNRKSVNIRTSTILFLTNLFTLMRRRPICIHCRCCRNFPIGPRPRWLYTTSYSVGLFRASTRVSFIVPPLLQTSASLTSSFLCASLTPPPPSHLSSFHFPHPPRADSRNSKTNDRIRLPRHPSERKSFGQHISA